MTVESASYINDLNTSYPQSSDARSEGDDHIRLIKTALKQSLPYLSNRLFRVTGALSGSQSPAYNTQNTQVFAFTGNGTLNLPAVASCGNGWMCAVYAPTGVTVSIDPNSTETINGSGSLSLSGGLCIAFCSGAEWFALVQSDDSRAIGEITAYAGTSLPTGWLWCDGSVISRSTYASLFAAISTNFGAGDGSTTFGLPDLRGRMPVGKDNMDNSVGTGGGAASRVTTAGSGVDGATLGASGGAQNVTLTTDTMPSHNHGGTAPLSGSTASDGSHTHTFPQYTDAGANTSALTNDRGTFTENKTPLQSGSAHSHSLSGGSATISSQGGGNAHNNMPPAQVVNYIIKAF